MTITLPDEARATLEQRAAQAGLPLEEYVLRAAFAVSPETLRDATAEESIRRWLADENGDSTQVPPEAIAHRKHEMEAALLAGLASGSGTPITAEFWEERRIKLQERQASPTDAVS